MARLLSLLIAFALVFTSGPAVAAAMCQHADAHAHAAARASLNMEVAAEALSEEAAAAKTLQNSTLADAAAVQLAGYVLAAEPVIPAPEASEPMGHYAPEDPALANRASRPLLEPPLA